VVDRPCEHHGNKQLRQRGHNEFDLDLDEYDLDSDGSREHRDNIELDLDSNFIELDTHDIELIDILDGIESRRLRIYSDTDVLVE